MPFTNGPPTSSGRVGAPCQPLSGLPDLPPPNGSGPATTLPKVTDRAGAEAMAYNPSTIHGYRHCALDLLSRLNAGMAWDDAVTIFDRQVAGQVQPDRWWQLVE